MECRKPGDKADDQRLQTDTNEFQACDSVSDGPDHDVYVQAEPDESQVEPIQHVSIVWVTIDSDQRAVRVLAVPGDKGHGPVGHFG